RMFFSILVTEELTFINHDGRKVHSNSNLLTRLYLPTFVASWDTFVIRQGFKILLRILFQFSSLVFRSASKDHLSILLYLQTKINYPANNANHRLSALLSSNSIYQILIQGIPIYLLT